MIRILILESFPGATCSKLFIKHPDITQADGILSIVIEISIRMIMRSMKEFILHQKYCVCKVGKQAQVTTTCHLVGGLVH